jgi:hypothetical protein
MRERVDREIMRVGHSDYNHQMKAQIEAMANVLQSMLNQIKE